MSNFKGVLFAAALLCLLVSCINSGKRENTAQQIRPEKSIKKNEEKQLSIAGFGFARSVDKSMTETWARNNALASLAEQSEGTSFTYSPVQQELKLEAASDRTFTGLSEPVIHEVYQNGKYWNAFTVYSSTAVIEIPEGFKTENREIRMQASNMQNLLQEGSKMVFRELTKQPDLQSSVLSGKIYLEEITVRPVTAGKEYSVTASFFIVYKQD